MKRKQIVAGPCSGPIVEAYVDKGPGRPVPRPGTVSGKTPRRYTINGGFRPEDS